MCMCERLDESGKREREEVYSVLVDGRRARLSSPGKFKIRKIAIRTRMQFYVCLVC